MKKLERFKLISRLLKNKEDLAAKQLAIATTELYVNNKKFTELRHLATEYENNSMFINKAIDVSLLKHKQKFIDYLDYVVLQQHDVVIKLKEEVGKRREHWLQYHTQNKGLKEYIEKLSKKATNERITREQKNLDLEINDRFSLNCKTPNLI